MIVTITGDALTLAMIHLGQMLHGGAELLSGVRYVLVGFGNYRRSQLLEADAAIAGSFYDQPGVSTGAPYRVVEGTSRGPRIVALPPSLHAAQPGAMDGVGTSPMVATGRAGWEGEEEEDHALGVSVAWEGCPEPNAFELKL